MILIAGVYDPDIERVKGLLDGYTFPPEQAIIDSAFARAELSIPEWAKAVQALASEQDGPFGFGSSASAGFISGYLTMYPTARVVSVQSDLLAAIVGTELDGFDKVAVARSIFGGQSAINGVLSSVPHTVIDMTKSPSDEEIVGLLGALERAA